MYQIDYEQELQPYIDRFDRMQIRGNKLISCSPFRPDTRPSFALNLDNGVWIDSGATDYKNKGDFYKLIELLTDTPYEQVRQVYEQLYDTYLHDVEQLELDLSELTVEHDIQVLPRVKEPNTSQYLLSRGITEDTQLMFGTYQQGDTICLPIKNKDGLTINVKHRKIHKKQFWYSVKCDIKQYLYGLDLAIQNKSNTIYVVEGEIDCLTLWQYGYPAVATFGASISEKQLTALKKFDTIVLAGDNDKVGKQFANKLANELLMYCTVLQLDLPEKYKDVNEVPIKERLETYCQLNEFKLDLKLKG